MLDFKPQNSYCQCETNTTFPDLSLHRCWISNLKTFIASVYCPMMVSLLYNFVILGLIVRSIRSRETMSMASKTSSNRQTIRVVTFLSCLLGLTWSFSVFVMAINHVSLQYIFAILNTLQGVFIFFFHIVRSEDVRKSWVRQFITSSKSPKPTLLEMFEKKSEQSTRPLTPPCSQAKAPKPVGFVNPRFAYKSTELPVGSVWYCQVPLHLNKITHSHYTHTITMC